MSDEHFYRVIADELASNNADTALWTQAYANAEGNIEKTKAIYIRLRLLALKKSTASPSITPLPMRESVNEPRPLASGLTKLRVELTEKLRIQGKTSLYTALSLTPSADDTVVASAIADYESKIHSGSIIPSAEFKYAKDTLGNPALREQYDRKLLNHLLDTRTQIRSSFYETDSYESESSFMSWWGSRKTSVIVTVLSVTTLGYLALGFTKERGTHNVQKEAIAVQREAVGIAGEIETARVMNEKLKAEAEVNLKNRSISLVEENAERQRREWQARQDMQQEQQAKRLAMEQERLKVQQQHEEERKAQRERQYWSCMNSQLNTVYYAEAAGRCRGYR